MRGFVRCSRSKTLAVVIKVIGCGLVVGGCAGAQQHDARSHVGMSYPGQVAVATPPKIELEDDGTAVQAPPRVQRRLEPDDPREPFSRNYGPAPERVEPREQPLDGRQKVEPQRKADAAPRPIILRSRLLSADEAHAVMVQAMIAHERRNP